VARFFWFGGRYPRHLTFLVLSLAFHVARAFVQGWDVYLFSPKLLSSLFIYLSFVIAARLVLSVNLLLLLFLSPSCRMFRIRVPLRLVRRTVTVLALMRKK
jgi:hypothetical protein